MWLLVALTQHTCGGKHNKTHVLGESWKNIFFSTLKKEFGLKLYLQHCFGKFTWNPVSPTGFNFSASSVVTFTLSHFGYSCTMKKHVKQQRHEERKTLSGLFESDEGWEPSSISRTHDRMWHICCVRPSDRNVVERRGRGALFHCNCLSSGILISQKVCCFALAATRCRLLGSKVSFHSGLSDTGVITFLLIVYLCFFST